MSADFTYFFFEDSKCRIKLDLFWFTALDSKLKICIEINLKKRILDGNNTGMKNSPILSIYVSKMYGYRFDI